MHPLIFKAMAMDVAVQTACFVGSYIARTERFYDFSGAITNVAVVLSTYQGLDVSHPRQTFLTFAAVTWASRLGLYLFTRIMRAGGRDRRFDHVRDNPARFGFYWAMQALWIFATNFAVIQANVQPVAQQPALGWLDAVGAAIWFAGFAIETIADYQKSSFRSNPANEHKFITTGLWKYSRHPNYFGEIALWWGSYIVAASSFSGYQHLAVLSPLFVTYLLSRVSGVPILERNNLKQFGSDPAYVDYVARTSKLLPLPPKKLRGDKKQ